MKRLFKLSALVLATATLVATLPACTETAETLTYVSLKVNPEIELIVDDSGEVLSVNAVNEDGEVVIEEGDFEGLTIEEACDEFTEVTTELGYVDVESEDTTVYVHVDGEDQEIVEETIEEVTEKVNESFEKRGIFGKAVKEDLEELTALANEWGVPVKDAKLVKRILDLYPEMSAEEVLALSIDERLELIKDNKENNGITSDMLEEYKQAVKNLKAKYETIKTLKHEIEDLENSLMVEGLTETEINDINALIKTKKTELEALKDAFKTELEEIKNQFRANVHDRKQGFKNHAEERKNQHKDKNDRHRQRFEENKEQIINDIKNWRK